MLVDSMLPLLALKQDLLSALESSELLSALKSSDLLSELLSAGPSGIPSGFVLVVAYIQQQ
jgi:hypothetical protein